MNADTLRAILMVSAQAAAQEKMLQAVIKEMQGMFSTMTSTSMTTHATSAEFVTNSLSARVLELTHDSENGENVCTSFDVWCSRYEDIITQDGAALDEAAEAPHCIEARCTCVRPLHQPHSSKGSSRDLTRGSCEDTAGTVRAQHVSLRPPLRLPENSVKR
uniref:DUF7083 domain-containing protein n=1 Tax=Haemonchus contortus TaxID=6289 RepID=A0A7I4YEE2_HAECO